MFKDYSYANHNATAQVPLADIVDFCELNSARTLEYVDRYTQRILSQPLAVQLEREIARQTRSLEQIAQIMDCDAEMLQDSARYYANIYNDFCHTGILMTCHHPYRQKWGKLSFPDNEHVTYDYFDKIAESVRFSMRFNMLVLPAFMQGPDWQPLRRSFAEVFLLTAHDHLHGVFSESVLALITPNPCHLSGFKDWHHIPLNRRICDGLGLEPFLRQTILAAGCQDINFLDDVMGKIERIAADIASLCETPEQTKTCHFMLYWMSRYIIPEWPEYHWRLSECVESLDPADIKKFEKKIATLYGREEPRLFSQFRKMSAKEMRQEIKSATQSIAADFQDFMARIDPVMPRLPLRPMMITPSFSP